MTEQERPRTEAPDWLSQRYRLDRLMPRLIEGVAVVEAEYPNSSSEWRARWLTGWLAELVFHMGTGIEEAARTEGRQQAVREIRARIADEVAQGVTELDPEQSAVGDLIRSILDRVAGLNASETMHDAFCILSRDHGGACDIPGLNASESPPVEDIAGDLWHQREGWHSMGDASESGQPPEASR